MLNNYAKFLGMEESTVMQTYAQALQLTARGKSCCPSATGQAGGIGGCQFADRWRKVLNPDLIIGSLLIVGLFAFIHLGGIAVFSTAAQAEFHRSPIHFRDAAGHPRLSTQPDLTGTAEAEASQEATALPGVAVVESTPTAVATVNSAPLQVYIIAHDRAYLDVTVDGKEAFVGRVVPNNVYTYSGNTGISLLTGNASALEVYFNQEYIGKLGGIGEVKRSISPPPDWSPPPRKSLPP